MKIKLCDFGTAKNTFNSSANSAANTPIGTKAYTSPELFTNIGKQLVNNHNFFKTISLCYLCNVEVSKKFILHYERIHDF